MRARRVRPTQGMLRTMAANADPWRTLGLAPGATQDEIRRAYRRLAKVNHPDAAGDAALPRFLAIQAAYEQLAGPGRIRRVGARPAARPSDGAPPNDPREPWRADPNRARASGRADGRRTPGARPAGAGSGGPSAGASGSRASSGQGRGGPAGPARASGASPGRAASGAGAGRPGTPPNAGGASGPEGEPATGRARRSSTRRRPATSATPGSTSYEGADQEPFEPGWSGATWYGASSGTYWTINPKEYADPRKHGPEYQARARRSRDGWILDGPADEPGSGDAQTDEQGPARGSADASADARRAANAGAPRTSPGSRGPAPDPVAGPFANRRPAGRRHRSDDAPAAGSTGRAGPAGHGGPAASAGPDSASPAAEARDPRFGGPRFAASGRGPGEAAGGGPPVGGIRSWIDASAGDRDVRGPLLRRPTTPAGRFAMALLGWPPLGVFAAAAIDQSTGCGRYAASCPEISSPGTWIVHAAILLLLLAVPAVAAWSAHGTIAALVAGIPSAIVLSAAGGTNVREQSGPILLGVLAIAYLLGVAYAIVIERRSAPA